MTTELAVELLMSILSSMSIGLLYSRQPCLEFIENFTQKSPEIREQLKREVDLCVDAAGLFPELVVSLAPVLVFLAQD